MHHRHVGAHVQEHTCQDSCYDHDGSDHDAGNGASGQVVPAAPAAGIQSAKRSSAFSEEDDQSPPAHCFSTH